MFLGDLGDAGRRPVPGYVAGPDPVPGGRARDVDEAEAKGETEVEVPVLVCLERLVVPADGLERRAADQRGRGVHRAVSRKRLVGGAAPGALCELTALLAGRSLVQGGRPRR